MSKATENIRSLVDRCDRAGMYQISHLDANNISIVLAEYEALRTSLSQFVDTCENGNPIGGVSICDGMLRV